MSITIIANVLRTSILEPPDQLPGRQHNFPHEVRPLTAFLGVP